MTIGMALPALGVSEFVSMVNQAMEYAFDSIVIRGELANFRVSKNRWVYFDLKDDEASVRFFGTVYMLPGPLEDGMMMEVRGTPRLHQQFGFSVTVQSMRLVGEGAIRKAAQLLETKLAAEGLFAPERKRQLPYPPQRVGLVTSSESAAYADFTKILAARWAGLEVDLIDVQVQGEAAPAQIVAAIQWFNQQAEAPEVLVVIRGGGGTDDLAAFSAEPVVRAVAASRVPTLVAIGHEIDTSLAELAADARASTPSNAAELLVPDRRDFIGQLQELRLRLGDGLLERLRDGRRNLDETLREIDGGLDWLMEHERREVINLRRLAQAYNPALALARGYAVVRGADGTVARTLDQLTAGKTVTIRSAEAEAVARIESVKGVDHGKSL